MPRTKTVTLDDASFKIASLTLEKAEEFFPTPVPERTTEEQIARMKEIVCFSLNGAGADPTWSPERIAKEMDIPLFNWLYMQILEMSGLKPASAGEARAAS
jgi:hypothetical protein